MCIRDRQYHQQHGKFSDRRRCIGNHHRIKTDAHHKVGHCTYCLLYTSSGFTREETEYVLLDQQVGDAEELQVEQHVLQMCIRDRLYREGMPGVVLFSGICAVAYFVVGIRFDAVMIADTPVSYTHLLF